MLILKNFVKLTAIMYNQVSRLLNGKVLILSDNADAARVWSYALSGRGIEPITREIDPISELPVDLDSFDLIIIDHYQGKTDILPVCQRVRTNSMQPILLFTYEADERYHLKAYEMGVEECVTKPVGIPLLLAKTQAWLNRATLQKTAGQELRVSSFRIDPDRRLLTTPEEKTIKLSNLECRLLYILMANRGQVLESGLLVDRIWSGYIDMDSRLVKNLIYRLRRKIERDPQHPQYIQTITGLGYVFRVPE